MNRNDFSVTALKKIKVGDYGILMVECEKCLYTAILFKGLNNSTQSYDASEKMQELPLYISYSEAFNEAMQIISKKESEAFWKELSGFSVQVIK
jgi:hypothetical protein